MLFNSLQFGIFFVIVYGLYLVLGHKWQNRLLLAASCVFYGSWDYRFLFLMFTSIITDFICSQKICASDDAVRRKRFLLISIFINLSILGFFKYFNFFASNFQMFLQSLGLRVNINLLHIILPVGISFYTFKTMSYTIDVYRKKLVPVKSLVDYALLVSFFPLLIAGPIERGAHLLPQVQSPRRITLAKVYGGAFLILWGLFLKVFIADNLAGIVDPVFSAAPPYDGAKILLAIYAFTVQIYCDFNGYSQIAMGLGRCMGFDIMVNFNLPYFVTNPRDFWHRWHISLSTWLRDYLYIPLGGNRKGGAMTYRNLFVTMLLGGLWHGAAWTFIIWGAYHGLLLCIHKIIEPVLARVPSPKNIFAGKIWKWLRIIFFFHLVCAGWLLFKANSFSQIGSMLTALIGNISLSNFISGRQFSLFVFLSLVIFAVEYLQYRRNDLEVLQMLSVRGKVLVGTVIVYFIAYSLIFGGIYSLPVDQKFIYFKF